MSEFYSSLRCPSCRYDLAGTLKTARCPECGVRLRLVVDVRYGNKGFRREAGWTSRRAVRVTILLGALGLVTIVATLIWLLGASPLDLLNLPAAILALAAALLAAVSGGGPPGVLAGAKIFMREPLTSDDQIALRRLVLMGGVGGLAAGALTTYLSFLLAIITPVGFGGPVTTASQAFRALALCSLYGLVIAGLAMGAWTLLRRRDLS